TAFDPILPATVALNSIEIQNGGILDGASSTITLTGAVGLNGGTGTWINNGTFTPGTSTVVINNAAATATGNTTFNNLSVSNALNISANSTVNVSSNLVLGTGVVTLGSNAVLGLNGSSITRNTGSINAQSTTSRVNIGGTTNLNIPANLFAGNIASLYINKTNVSTNTVTLNNAFTAVNTIIASGKIDRNSNNFTSTNCTNVIEGTTMLNTGGTGTFSCGVPVLSGGTYTEIEVTDDVVNVTENTTIGNLKLNPGKRLAIGLNKKLTITGEITGDGTITGGETAEIEIINAPSTSTTLKLDPSNKSSKSLKNLIVSGGGTLVIGDTIRVEGTITLSSGSVVNTSNVLVIPNNGRVGDLTASGGGSFSGTVIAELLIPAGKRAFRTVANPFANNIDLRQLTDDIDITGTITSGNFAGFTTTATNNPSAYWLNSNAASDISRFVPLTSENPSIVSNNTWSAGQGIRVLVRGAKGEGLTGSVYTPSEVTIDLIGTMNDKNGSTLVNLPTMDATNTGKWAAVSNPFISPIAFSNALSSSNIATAGYFVWDVSLGTKGAYRQLNFTDVNNLPKFAALFVRNSSPTAAAASITFTESVKTSTSSLSVFKTAKKINNSLAIDIKLDTFNLDAFTAIFDSSYKNEYDLNEDLDKFFNPDFNLFLSSNGKSLSVERRNFPREEETFVLNSIFTEGGNYRFDFTRSDLPKAYDFYLVDQFTKKEILLTNNSVYSFDVDFANEDSKARYRFALVAMGKANSLDAVSRFVRQSYEVYPNPFNKDLTITVINAKKSGLTNFELYSQTGSLINKGEIAQGVNSHTISTEELSSGVYFLNIIDVDGVTTKKIIK
ncbi:MAG: T9SS type A sorting domain-containing protein, partial [Sediminibacterium sp.]